MSDETTLSGIHRVERRGTQVTVHCTTDREAEILRLELAARMHREQSE